MLLVWILVLWFQVSGVGFQKLELLEPKPEYLDLEF